MRPRSWQSAVRLCLLAALVLGLLSAAPAGAGERVPRICHRYQWGQFRNDPAKTGHNRCERTLGVGNASQLQLKWSVPPDEHLVGYQSSPSVAAEVVYAGRSDGVVQAFDALTGTLLWDRRIGTGIQASPAVGGGLVFIGTTDDVLYALDSGTGNGEWSYATGGDVSSSATVHDGVVYVGSDDDHVYAFVARTGALQ